MSQDERVIREEVTKALAESRTVNQQKILRLLPHLSLAAINSRVSRMKCAIKMDRAQAEQGRKRKKDLTKSTPVNIQSEPPTHNEGHSSVTAMVEVSSTPSTPIPSPTPQVLDLRPIEAAINLAAFRGSINDVSNSNARPASPSSNSKTQESDFRQQLNGLYGEMEKSHRHQETQLLEILQDMYKNYEHLVEENRLLRDENEKLKGHIIRS